MYSEKCSVNLLSEFTPRNSQRIHKVNSFSKFTQQSTHQIYSWIYTLKYSANLPSEFTPWNSQRIHTVNSLNKVLTRFTIYRYSAKYSANVVSECTLWNMGGGGLICCVGDFLHWSVYPHHHSSQLAEFPVFPLCNSYTIWYFLMMVITVVHIISHTYSRVSTDTFYVKIHRSQIFLWFYNW